MAGEVAAGGRGEESANIKEQGVQHSGAFIVSADNVFGVVRIKLDQRMGLRELEAVGSDSAFSPCDLYGREPLIQDADRVDSKRRGVHVQAVVEEWDVGL